MATNSYQGGEVEVLEAAIEGIHKARLAHRILSTFATRTDSVLLARAALDAIHAGGFTIVRREDA